MPCWQGRQSEVDRGGGGGGTQYYSKFFKKEDAFSYAVAYAGFRRLGGGWADL